MSAAITQAKLAMGLTSPNPPVGAIIVSQENKIIGMGNTQPYGKNHAEIEAIKSAGNNVKNSTLYTTLEPCNIELNTPPCTKSIIQSNIKHVIIGTKDPNPKINGKGIKILEENGITTEVVKYNESLEYTLEAYKYFVKNKSEKKIVPNFLIDLDKEELNNVNLLDGLMLVGDYLEKSILKPNNMNYPTERLDFINILK